ncbi:MAG: ADOP family duplicated permease, partial [Thermoanaerobaculia bacterium]|nr:ADOP family duplicated permease [Thermoanaerobaculia bacterium]
GEMATGTLFPVLGLRPARGRLLGPDDDRPGAARVVVLSYNSWRKRFGGADDIVGRTVRVNGEPMTVVGIAPQHFSSVLRGFETEVWVPVHSAFELGITPSQNDGYFQAGETLADARGRNWLWPVGRLAEGASYEQAAAEIAALGTALAADFPDTHERQSLRSLPMSDVKMVPTVDAGIATASAVLLAVVALVLLIACANLANLLLARALSRHREMATRLSLGASAGSLVRQLLIESLLLAGAGAGGGLAVAWLATKVVNRIELPMIVPISVTTTLDARVLVFTVALAAATALFFGLAPALQAGRTDIATLLREDSARGGTARRRRLQAALVTAQVALSVVLLAFGGLSLRSAWNTQDVDLGFEPAGAAAMILSPDLQGYTETEIEQFYKRLKQALASQPGVVSTTASSQIPLSMFINTTTAVADGSSLDYEDWPSVDNARVDEDYFETLDTAIIAGRDFDAADCRDQRRVAIVNTTLADRFWPGEDPLGMLVRTRPDRDPYTVVGVAEDGKYRTLGESPRPFLFLPISDRYDVRAVVARFASPGQANPKVLADAVRSIDDSLAISSLGTVTDVIGTMYFLPRAGALIFGIMGALGLGLAAMGLYGVLAYAVGQRTHEIGVRVAMGARSTDIVRLVTRQGLVLTAIGALLGLAGAIASTRALSAILYGVGPTDLVTFAAVVVVLLAIAALAAWIPARRATRLDPLEALRYE